MKSVSAVQPHNVKLVAVAICYMQIHVMNVVKADTQKRRLIRVLEVMSLTVPLMAVFATNVQI